MTRKKNHPGTSKLSHRRKMAFVRIIPVAIILLGLMAWQLRSYHRVSLPDSTKEVQQDSGAETSHPSYGISLADSFFRQTPGQINEQLAAIKKLGFTDVRFTVSWYIVQPNSSRTYTWRLYDQLINAINRNGLDSLAIIDYTPAWARVESCKTSAYCPPADPSKYATFAAATASRYSRQGVHNYEIWNEENIKVFWHPVPDARIYAALVKATYPAIKKADPSSTVILGSMSGASTTSPGYIEPREFLSSLYANGVRNNFDVLGYHAYTFPELPDDISGGKNAWAKLNSVKPSLRSIMVSNGDGGKSIWITEVGAPTNGSGTSASLGSVRSSSSDHTDTALQATIAQQVLVNSTHMPWLGRLYWYTYKDAGTTLSTPENFYGLLNYAGQPKPALKVFETFFKSHTN